MTRPHAQESDAELLHRVAERHLDRPGASRAEELLYARHVRYLYGVLLKRERPLLDLAGMAAEDLVQETFQRAFARAHTYSDGGVADPQRAERRTRAWLGRIAHHLLVDALRGEREISDSPFIEQASADPDEAPPSRPELAVVREGLGQLSDREQDVLRVTALYYRAGELHQRLPNEASAELAARWGTTNENVRAIRRRALKKLSSFLSARGLSRQEAT